MSMPTISMSIPVDQVPIVMAGLHMHMLYHIRHLHFYRVLRLVSCAPNLHPTLV